MHLTGMEAMARTVDQELLETVASAASGDEIAFARIVAAYNGEMHRVCVVVARDRVIAEQEEAPPGDRRGSCAGAVLSVERGYQSLSTVIWSQRAPALWPMM